MGTEITLLSGVIFGIDENGVVGTRSHAGLATNANRFIKINDAVRAFEHRRGRTSRDTGRVCALIATRNLVGPSCLRKNSDVDVLNIRARDAEGDDVFGLAGGRAGMTTDTTSVVDYLGPLDLLWLKHRVG